MGDVITTTIVECGIKFRCVYKIKYDGDWLLVKRTKAPPDKD